MTLTAEQSSNKARFEAAPTAEIINIIRAAMVEGCIRPCHVYDAVDELICRIQALESKPKRNCDVGTAEEQNKRLCSNYFSIRRSDHSFSRTALEWAQMPYVEKDGGAK